MRFLPAKSAGRNADCSQAVIAGEPRGMRRLSQSTSWKFALAPIHNKDLAGCPANPYILAVLRTLHFHSRTRHNVCSDCENSAVRKEAGIVLHLDAGVPIPISH